MNTGEVVLAVQFLGQNVEQMRRFCGPIPGDELGICSFDWNGETAEVFDPYTRWVPVPIGSWVVKTPRGFEVLTDAAMKRRYLEKK